MLGFAKLHYAITLLAATALLFAWLFMDALGIAMRLLAGERWIVAVIFIVMMGFSFWLGHARGRMMGRLESVGRKIETVGRKKWVR
jgi:hypothetical protein